MVQNHIGINLVTIQKHLAKLIADANFDCVSVEFNCLQLPNKMHRERLPLTVPGGNEHVLEQLLPRCSFPCHKSNFSSVSPLVQDPVLSREGTPGAPPVSSGCQGAASPPFIPELPQESCGLPRVRASIILLDFKGCVCILFSCECVRGGGCARSPGSFAFSLSLKERRANNSSNLAERTTNSLC